MKKISLIWIESDIHLPSKRILLMLLLKILLWIAWWKNLVFPSPRAIQSILDFCLSIESFFHIQLFEMTIDLLVFPHVCAVIFQFDHEIFQHRYFQVKLIFEPCCSVFNEFFHQLHNMMYALAIPSDCWVKDTLHLLQELLVEIAIKDFKGLPGPCLWSRTVQEEGFVVRLFLS